MPIIKAATGVYTSLFAIIVIIVGIIGVLAGLAIRNISFTATSGFWIIVGIFGMLFSKFIG